MKLQEARNLIKTTFENKFDKARFNLFIKNLLKDAYEEKPFIQTGGQLPQAFAELIRKLERIGKYEDEEGNIIDILAVELKRGHSIEWARTAQRNFIRRYLNGSRGGELKDAALVAFYSEGSEDWRFSLIKMQYSLEKKADELTPAKRFSFLVGKNERSHTAQNQLADLLTLDSIPTLAEIESSFNIETVTKEFFEKYKQLFLDLNDHIEKEIKKSKQLSEELERKNIDSVSFSKKLLGQIVFLYFLQKKGWLGVPKNENWNKGDKQFLRTLLEEAVMKKKNFFSDYLVFLFYEALATEHRGGSDPSYYPRLNCRIPFLNGGLFEADYDWKKIEITIPNDLFTNPELTEQGDIGTGVLDVFDRYNFTVKEDEPLEKEVAVDPEMLGKVFENLLEVKDRKSKGAFYTPREIVHYMCQESLIAYLENYLNEKYTNSVANFNDIEPEIKKDLFGAIPHQQYELPVLNKTVKQLEKQKPQFRHDLEKFIREGTAAIDNDAQVIKIERETETYFFRIPKSIINNAREIDKALSNIRICDPAIGSGAFPVGMMNEIVKAREILTTYLPESKNRSAYEFKRHAIQECIYGVDIDHSAIDIAKLRLWLSLVVDEEDFYKIKPLPNLDYKIVCGNSLISYPYDPRGLDKVEKLKYQFFELTNHKDKEEYRGKINDAINSLLNNTEKSLGYKVDFDFKIHLSEVFRVKKGFDVVIGNPPYVEAKKLKDVSQTFRKIYSTYSGTADLYVYFYENGIKQLRDSGILMFITSNKFIKTSYGEKLRRFLTTHRINEIIDFTDIHVFNALVSSCIFSLTKSKVIDNKIRVAFANDRLVNFSGLSTFVQQNNFFLSQDGLTGKIWQLEPETKLSLKYKIEKGSTTMSKTVTINIYRGVTTGFNPAFIITDEKRKELIKEDKVNKEIIKPLLQGRNIRKWIYNKSDTFLLQTGYDLNIKKEYPVIFNHLNTFKQELVIRADQGLNWWNLRACKYYQEFEKEKIIWGLTSDKWTFAYDNENNYLPSNGYILTSSEIPIKYLLALLNSKLMMFYFSFIGIMTAGGAFTLKYETVIEFPIKKISLREQKPFVILVDKILDSKKQDPNANTSKLEKQIDIMVYHLYNLTYEEAKIIDPELSEEEFEKYKINLAVKSQ
jgi:23S rRNA G2445 N2-methylase RlmL